MSDINRMNVSALKSYKNDFSNERNQFINSVYNTYASGSYTSSYPALNRLLSKLKGLIEQLNSSYQSSDDWWEKYNKNVESLERYLAHLDNSNSMMEFEVISYINSFPILREYNSNLGNTMISTEHKLSSGLFNEKQVNTKVSNQFEKTAAVVSNQPTSGWTKSKKSNWFLDTFNKVTNNIKSVGADVSNLASGIVDGVLRTGESAFDLFTMAGTGVASVATGIYDLVTGDNSTKRMWDDTNAFVSKDHTSIFYDNVKKVGKVVESVGADVANVAVGFSEGIVKTGESIVDLASLVGTGVLSVATGAYDLITGSDATKKMWEGTKAFVSKDYTSGWYDDFYENTGVGNWISDKGHFVEGVRGISSGVGQIMATVGLTVLTAGAASGVAGAASATGGTAGAAAKAATAFAKMSTSAKMATTGAALGFSRGTQDSWADGADIGEGLGYGAVSGAIDGVMYGLGAKVNGINPFKGASAASKVGNIAVRSIADGGLDGVAEGIIRPGLKTMYKDGYIDENGNYIEFSNGDSWFKKYSESFDDEGGWANVLTNAAIGSAFSLSFEGVSAITDRIGISNSIKNTLDGDSKKSVDVDDEIFDLSKYFKNKKIKLKKLDNNTLEKLIISVSDVDNLKEIFDNGAEKKLINIISQLDDANIGKITSNLDATQLMILLTKKNIDDVTYRSIINSLEMEQLIQSVQYIRGFKGMLDVKAGSNGVSKMISTSWLLNIIKDDSIFRLYSGDFDNNTVLFKGLSKNEIANGLKQIDDMMKNNGYSFKYDWLQQIRIENVIANDYLPPRVVDLNIWADTIMTSNFRRLFPSYVTDTQLSALSGTYRFLEPADFAKAYTDPNVMAFNNGVESVMNLDYPDDIIRSSISHESLHQISSKPRYYDPVSGFSISKSGLHLQTYDPNVGNWTSKYKGINETVTEFLNELAMGKDYPTTEHCGYQSAVLRLKQLLNMNIEGFNSEVIKKAYIDSDVSPLASAIDKIASPNFFEGKLVPAFDKAIEGNLFELDKIILELKIFSS